MDSVQLNPLHKKVDKILNSDIDLDTLNALKNVSHLVSDNTLSTRRNLRAKIETQSLLINEHFAKSFNEVYENFEAISNNIGSIESACENLMQNIQDLKFQTSDFSKQASRIRNELKTLDDNEKTLNNFLGEYTLSASELAMINSEIKIDDNFFEILNKISRIHDKAKSMLASNQLITGFEIMETMAKYEEIANEKLYRCTVNILRTANLDFIELHSHLFDALAHLQKNNVLFKHCLDEYTIVRRSAVTHAFIEALTRGRSSNNTNYPAMELYSNDIVRYIRDMLSFLHQTFVFERDMFKTLLKSCNQEELTKKNVLKNVISSITEGVMRILKIRVENCLITTNDRVTDTQAANQIKRTKNLFLVKNIINFYLQTFNQMLNEDCAFVHFIKQLLISSDKVCYNSLKYYCSQLASKLHHTTNTGTHKMKISCDEQLHNYNQLIEELLDCIKSSISFSVQEQQLETQRILSCVFEPCTQSIIIWSSKFAPIEMTVYNINCFNILQRTIQKHKHTEAFLDILQKQMDEWSDILVNEQLQSIISALSLNSLYNAITQNVFVKSNVPLSSLSGCDPIAVATFLANFDKFVSNPKQLQMKRLADINNPAIRDSIWNKALKLIVTTYDNIYKLLMDPDNKYMDIIDSIKHKPSDVEKMIFTN